jgi:hypothetical protein
MIRDDHIKHFFVCFIITALGTIPWWIWQQRWMVWIPVALGLLAGFYKEFKDIRTTGFDWTDILADVVGIVTALSLWGVGR